MQRVLWLLFLHSFALPAQNSYIDSLTQVAATAPADTNLIRTYHRLIQRLYGSRLQEADSLTAVALDLAQNLDAGYLLGRSHYLRALTQEYLGEINSALYHVRQARASFVKHRRRQEVLMSYELQSNIHLFGNQPDSALQYAIKGQTLAHEIGDKIGEGVAAVTIANLYSMREMQ
ncbi:MAG: hypothetical protein AAFU03_18355, partial [Bacteroidota bacterium]